MHKRLLSLVLVIAVILVVAGCGSNNTKSPAANESATGNATATNAGSEAASGPIVLKDAKGEVKLDKPAQKVVVLEWTFTEDIIALGMQPQRGMPITKIIRFG